jgi:hypothetical protein
VSLCRGHLGRRAFKASERAARVLQPLIRRRIAARLLAVARVQAWVRGWRVRREAQRQRGARAQGEGRWQAKQAQFRQQLEELNGVGQPPPPPRAERRPLLTATEGGASSGRRRRGGGGGGGMPRRSGGRRGGTPTWLQPLEAAPISAALASKVAAKGSELDQIAASRRRSEITECTPPARPASSSSPDDSCADRRAAYLPACLAAYLPGCLAGCLPGCLALVVLLLLLLLLLCVGVPH